MKTFLDDNFLLSGETARKLYFDWAADRPIFDFHCHLNPRELVENRTFQNITEAWLGGDHYKWRAMRSAGIDEEHITGSADPREKFTAYAYAVSRAPGNPLYHWSHLELRRYFGIDTPLTRDTAGEIYDRANEKLASGALRVRDILKASHVWGLVTTDDPADTLADHRALREDPAFSVRALPGFRPDKALRAAAPDYRDYLTRLSEASGVDIDGFDALCRALDTRIDFFDSLGCRASDHALDTVFFSRQGDPKAIFARLLAGKAVAPEELECFQTALLLHLGRRYFEKRWVMELHVGALRNNNARMLSLLGPDTGFDAIHDAPVSEKLSNLLSALDADGVLPRTVLFCLNPKDYYPLGTLMGCFQGGGIPGKIQLGTAWWFCDHRDGMKQQISALSNLGVLGTFIGMLTDSRSFLSYPRHELFRRILCDTIGTWIDGGELPRDLPFYGQMVRDISFDNAKQYFGL